MKATLLFLKWGCFQEILLIGLFVWFFSGAKRVPEFMKDLERVFGSLRRREGCEEDVEDAGK